MKKVGIIGGGQLGRMLCLAAAPLGLETFILDVSAEFPAARLSDHFVLGNFKNEDDVYNFGKKVDILTIEIEHVNINALRRLEQEGVVVHPSAAALAIIQDKGLQKAFYVQHQLPTANFWLFTDAAAVRQAVAENRLTLPFVQKTRTLGYDGQGVCIIRTQNDLHVKLMDAACVVEQLVEVEKELAIIVARSTTGEVVCYPAVEMLFEPEANLVELLVCPADITPKLEEQARLLAERTIAAFDLCGLLAVEMFLTKDGHLLINEVAPRPHNSGHHTIEACHTSQFEQHLRAILGWHLGDVKLRQAAAMLNLLGAKGYEGEAVYEGVEACFAMEAAHIHIYGKKNTKPLRKMGHITTLANTTTSAVEKAIQLKKVVKVIAKK